LHHQSYKTDIPADGYGYVITEGILEGINTSAATAGQSIWLSGTAGDVVYGAPPAKPAHSVYLGVVIRSQSVNGKVYVKVQNGYELEELHNVLIATPTTGQALVYDSTAALWKNTTIAAGAITSDTAPTSPKANDIWYQSSTGKTFIYFDLVWVEMLASTGSVGPAGATGTTPSSYVSTAGGSLVTAASTSTVPLRLQGIASQTANLFEATSNDGIHGLKIASGIYEGPSNAVTTLGGGAIYHQRLAESGGLLIRRQNGTLAAPTQVLANERLGYVIGSAFDGANFSNNTAINFNAAENITSTARGSYITLEPKNVGATGRNEKMRIDPSGRVTTPAQPAFSATSTNTNTVGQDIVWNNTTQNVGSHFNTTNGRFTAPVAGFYYFHAHGLWNNAAAGDMRMGLYVNGSGAFSGMRFITDKVANVWHTWFIDGVVYMNANDYATTRIEQTTGALHGDANYNQFSGRLLG